MVKHISFTDQIIIYWLLDDYIENASYRFYIDDKLVGEGNKTDYTFRNLKPATSYNIKVYEHDKLFYEDNISTDIKKCILDVSKYVDNSGKTNVTKGLQSLINAINSGSILYFPKGTYLTGALYLKSNMDIYLDEGATILGSESRLDYLPKIKSRFEGHELDCYASLINIGVLDHSKGYETSNIIIRGKGAIIGGGNPLANDIINEEIKYIKDEEVTNPKVGKSIIAGRRRNRLINISNAKDVVIEGLKLGYSSSWNVHMTYSSNIITTNCLFESFGIHNGDGWDPDSSNNCILFNSTFNSGDDCVAIKSGKNIEGNEINIPSYNISIFDIKTIRGHGCAIGSELSGGIYNVDIFDSDFTNTIYGMHIKTTKKRGGYCKNVRVKNISISAINIDMVTYNDDGISADTLTEFSNFKFDNVTLSGIMYEDIDKIDTQIPLKIVGFPDDPKAFNNMSFTNIKVTRDIAKEEMASISNSTDVDIDIAI